MKQFIQNFALLSIAIASLSACAIHAGRTTGPVAIAQPITKYRLIWNPVLPSRITLYGSTDEEKAIADNRTLYELLVRLFPQRFNEKAAPYGMYATESPNEQASKLVLRVDSVALSCYGLLFGCQPILRLATNLVDEKGTSVWEYSSNVTNPTIFTKIDGHLVDAYVDALLAAMLKDKVVVRSRQ